MNYRAFVVASVLSLLMVGACRSDNHGIAMDTEMEKALRDLEGSISKNVITKGDFRSLTIGQPKKAAISSLQRMGVGQVFPDVVDVITITQSSELGKLSDTDSIVLNEGVVWVSFDGDVVQQIKAPPHSDLERLFKSLKTRGEVLRVLSDILDSDSKEYVRNLGSDARWVNLDEITDDDLVLLEKYDSWKVGFSDSNGYWHLQLRFGNTLLREIVVQHAPGELP